MSQDVKYDYTVNSVGTGDRSAYDTESYWKAVAVFQEWMNDTDIDEVPENRTSPHITSLWA